MFNGPLRFPHTKPELGVGRKWGRQGPAVCKTKENSHSWWTATSHPWLTCNIVLVWDHGGQEHRLVNQAGRNPCKGAFNIDGSFHMAMWAFNSLFIWIVDTWKKKSPEPEKCLSLFTPGKPFVVAGVPAEEGTPHCPWMFLIQARYVRWQAACGVLWPIVSHLSRTQLLWPHGL